MIVSGCEVKMVVKSKKVEWSRFFSSLIESWNEYAVVIRDYYRMRTETNTDELINFQMVIGT